VGHGILKHDATGWVAAGGMAGLPDATALSLARDSSGRILIGYPENRLAVIDKGHVQVYGSANGLVTGNILAMAAHGAHTWVAGSGGVVIFSRGRFWPLLDQAGSPFEGVSGIVETRGGELWMNGAAGVTRLSANVVKDFLANPTHLVISETFNGQDGLHGTASPLHPVPTAVESGDGRLWFSTTSGVFSIDPAGMARNAKPPASFIQAAVAADKVYPASPLITLPKSTGDIELRYTATGLTMPTRMRFRYMLEPLQTNWLEVGARRQAYFTNLQPGSYTFSVIAANEDGLWGDKPASVSIFIPPAFWQTAWFKAWCAVLLALMLIAIYFLRVRAVARQMATRFRDLARERERIARELHDTLLQGTSGLVLQFEGIASALPSGDAVKARIEAVLGRADSVLEEARSCVLWLRSDEHVSIVPLISLFSVAQEFSALAGIALSFETTGDLRKLKPTVEAELHRIGSESLSNAFHHSHATTVKLELNYSDIGVRLAVTDDGVGLDDETRTSGRRAGHWGLVGMRERAAKIGASFVLKSGVGAGTKVEVTILANKAFMKNPGNRLRALKARAAAGVFIFKKT